MGEKLQLAKELLMEFYQTAKRYEEQCRELQNQLQARDQELEALKKLQAELERRNADISQRLKDKDAELEKQGKRIDRYLRPMANDCAKILDTMKAMDSKAAVQDQRMSECFDQLRIELEQFQKEGRERVDVPVPREATPEKSPEMQIDNETWQQLNSAQ